MESQRRKKWIIRSIGWVLFITLGVYTVYHPMVYTGTIADFGTLIWGLVVVTLVLYKPKTKK